MWGISVGDHEDRVPFFEASLSDAERDRAARFHFDRHRLIYVVAHGMLRDVLSRYVDADPASVSLGATEEGRPFIEGASDLDFSLSHADDAAVVAIARGRRVGVDIEKHRPDMEHASLAERFFTPEEVAAIRAAGSERVAETFFDCWTRKEAIVKAVGRGITMRLCSFAVSPGVAAERVSTGLDGTWDLVSLDLTDDYAGAVAMEPDADVATWLWRPASRG